MNLQKKMNQTMQYIEDHLTKEMDYSIIAQLMCISEGEYRRIFSFLTQTSLSEYIRKRRLSMAVVDIRKGEKIITVSNKYGYDSQAAFSRAFKSMHGIAPSEARKKDAVIYSYPPITFKLVLMEEVEMKEDKTRVIVGGHGDRYGITMDLNQNLIHETNDNFWSTKGNDIIGCLALPLYGAFISEEKCGLLGEVKNKKVLDVCCGTGESLLYVADKGADELWGIDMSKHQLNIANKVLNDKGYEANLICAPMEKRCTIENDYFDIIYSVYGIGWSTDLDETFKHIYSYLKEGGSFIFSWSHPIHKCVSVENDALFFKKSYFDESWYALSLDGETISLSDRKLSTYINALSKAGFVIEKLVEESHEDLLQASDSRFSKKAEMLPVTFVIKARKGSKSF